MLLLSVALYFGIPPKSPIFEENYSTSITANDGSLLHIFLNNDEQWYLAPDTITIPEKLKQAVICFEDQRFYDHSGINIRAIARAFWQNITRGEIVSGASTIPMQIARMSNPKSRTYVNKIMEICFAIKLDLHHSKDELLRLYLQNAPYGGNVIGYKTAALKFYNKQPYELTWSEAATLAILPNAPGMIYPKEGSSALETKRNRLLNKLFNEGVIDKESYQLACLESVPKRFLIYKSKAPHLANYLHQKHPAQWDFKTSIDPQLQSFSNTIAEKYHSIYKNLGVHNLSILICDTENGAVKAYVGSPNFFDAQHGGQVDGVMAHRSSGSTLKPLLLACCIDEGIVIPDSYVHDIPTYYDGFSPKNADRKFRGMVSAREAMVHSLNIPAVRMLKSYGLYQFYHLLKRAGVNTLFRDADDYGLPLILGGAEVSMWSLVKLYRGLANGGKFSDNHFGENNITPSTQLISPGSAWLTLDVLTDVKRPGSEYYWRKYSSAHNIAWKTGTSYAHKDAWAVGVNPKYTIAVWVGNFNGEGNKNIGGAKSAGPILFELFRAAMNDDHVEWFEQNMLDFKQIEVCDLTGFRANKSCTHTHMADVPKGMKPLPQCDFHYRSWLSDDGEYTSCSRCWHHCGKKETTLCSYPPDIAYYLRKQGIYIPRIPEHYPNCTSQDQKQKVTILYPNDRARIFLPRDFDGKQQSVLCKAAHTANDKKLFWYLATMYLGTTVNKHERPVTFLEGWNRLRVIDENGNESAIRVYAGSTE